MAEEELSEPIKLFDEKLRPLPDDGSGCPKQQGLRVGALNAGSIIGKIKKGENDGIQKSKILTDCIKDNGFHIFVTIETWLKDSNTGNQWDLDNYSCVRKDRKYAVKKENGKRRTKTKNTNKQTKPNPKGGQGGGILIYIHESVNYKVKSRGEYAESNVEFLHIEITSPVQLHLVALYCPQKILVDHLISLMSHFVDPLGERKIMFIGDTNIDRYGSKTQDRFGNTFFDLLSQKPYEVKQLIDRITHDKACIDHIFTNLEVVESGVMKNRLSPEEGHKVIFCTIPCFLKSELEPLLQDNKYILGIFYKLSQNADVPEVTTDIHWFQQSKELVYYKEFNTKQQVEDNINSVNQVIEALSGTDSEMQWIIFTKEVKRCRVYRALKQRMLAISNDQTQNTSVEFLGCMLNDNIGFHRPTDSDYLIDDIDEKDNIQQFMTRLTGFLKEDENRCILAVFYQFHGYITLPEKKPRDLRIYMISHQINRQINLELACYIKVNDDKKVDDSGGDDEDDVTRHVHRDDDDEDDVGSGTDWYDDDDVGSGTDWYHDDDVGSGADRYDDDEDDDSGDIDEDDQTIDGRIQLIQKYTKELHKLNKAKASAVHKQCIIFTRNSRSPVFHALQKKIWYKEWDFVWQPRHVEFLGYVLEPSLTYAFRIKVWDTVWNIPQTKGEEDKEEEEKKAIALQESTYRYWSDNWKSIKKL